MFDRYHRQHVTSVELSVWLPCPGLLMGLSSGTEAVTGRWPGLEDMDNWSVRDLQQELGWGLKNINRKVSGSPLKQGEI